MNGLIATVRRHSTSNGRCVWPATVACFIASLVLIGCSDDASSPLEPLAGSSPTSDYINGSDHGRDVARVVGSLVRAPHSWAIVNWSTIRGLDATLDGDGNPDGSFELDIEIDFGVGPFLQQTTEDVICLEVAERDDDVTDIWISSAAKGWVTVPEGVTHFAIIHIADMPGGDLLTARSIQPDEGEPSEFCETRPDLSATDPTGFGPAVLMPAEAGNVVSIDRTGRRR